MERIEKGMMKEHDRIPSERELCDTYDISRATVRQAIQILEKEGVIYKQHGKGTFVSPIKMNQDLLKFYSFTEEMRKLGKTVSTKIMGFDIIDNEAEINRRMQLKDEVKLYKIVRLRYADDEPMMIVTTYLPVERFPGITKDDLEGQSLYDVLTHRFNAVFSKAEEHFQPVYTGEIEAVLLGTDVNSPSMKIERITYEGGAVIEYGFGIARGDKFRYGVVLEK